MNRHFRTSGVLMLTSCPPWSEQNFCAQFHDVFQLSG